MPRFLISIQNQRKFHYSHLKNLFLSDFSSDDDNKQIDVLIGAGYYRSFMSGKVIHGNDCSSPIALKSRIGWVLSGPSLCPKIDVSSLVTVYMNVAACNAATDELTDILGSRRKPLPHR